MPIKMTEYLRDEYPGEGNTAFNESEIKKDYGRDEWKFLRDMATDVAKNIMLDYSGALFDTAFEVFAKIGDWVGENVKLDLETGHIEIPAWNFNTRDISAEKTLDAIDTWDDAAVDYIRSLTPSQPIEVSIGPVTSWFGPSNNRTVFVDANFNGVYDDGEPRGITAEDGQTFVSGSVPIDVNDNGMLDPSEGQWVALGGVDLSVDRPIEVVSRAPSNYGFITPTSTLMAELLHSGAFERSEAGHIAAERRVLDALGVEQLPNANFNFVRTASGGDADAALLFARETAFYNLVIGVAKLFEAAEGAFTLPQLADVVVTDVADKIAAPGASLNAASAIVIENIIEGVSVRTGIAIDPLIRSAVSTTLANANARIEALSVEGSQAYLEDVVRVQQTAQSSLADRIQSLVRGELTLGLNQARIDLQKS